MFGRDKIGEEKKFCPKCGAEMKFFVQHSHGNYPILDWVCPNCDLGGDEAVPEWWSSSGGKEGGD